MGNKNAKNDDFSKNPNFNINQHQQAMRNLQNNYYDSNLQVNGGPPGQNTKVKQTEFKSVHRTASIYKPSINIHHSPNSIKIQFKYDSDLGSKLEVYIGVTNVDEDPQSHLTKLINSQIFFEETLPMGKKCQFSKQYSLLNSVKMVGCCVVLRIMNLYNDERTQYSIKNVGKQNWKVLLQKLQINGLVTQLHNIYKGGHDGEQCIICFTQAVDTLVEPCNHLCLCYNCCNSVRKSTNTCPICRTHISGFKKIKNVE